MSQDWPFEGPTNLAVITTRQIIIGGAPVMMVSRDYDDDGWQFLHGGVPEAEDAMVVSLGNIVGRDPGLRELADLPPGWIAWRSAVGQPWNRERHPAE